MKTKRAMQFFSFLEVGGKSFFDFSMEEQKVYIEKLGNTSDDIDRSYKQFLCQRFFVPWYIKVITDIVAFFVMPILMVWYFVKGLSVKQGEQVKCISDFKGFDEVIPEEISQQYYINHDIWFLGVRLSFSDISYILKLVVRHPFSPMFVNKCMMKLARYSYMIHCHFPEVILVHNEFSFTSSVLTNYCEKYDVKHIDIMHGEKLYCIRDSYFHFHECYVWDDFYVNLFTDLKAEPSQFIIAVPKSLMIDCENYRNAENYADYKYYLQAPTEEKLKTILRSMEFAIKEGKTVKYRPHPRYTDMGILERIVDKKNIEYPKDVSIFSSVANCSCVVGSYTTVLLQAYKSGIYVLFDDVAEKEIYDELEKRRYILIGKGIPCLSRKQ